MGIIETVKGRWQYFALGAVVVLVALAWAIFPSLSGGVPERLISDPVAIGDITCADCTFFDLDAADVSASDGTYSRADAQPILEGSTDSNLRWGIGRSQGEITLDFSVGNNTDNSQLLVRAMSLEVLEVSEIPSEMRLACVPTGSGSFGAEAANVTEFSVGLDPASAGTSTAIPVEEGSHAGIALDPEDIRAYRGDIGLAEPGVYTLAVSVDYETPGGDSATVESNPIDLMLVSGQTTVTAIPPASDPVCQGIETQLGDMTAFLSDVILQDADGGSTVEFAFRDLMPGFTMAYVEPPIVESPSGREIDVKGSRFLEVRMTQASGVDLSGAEPQQTYEGPARIDGRVVGVAEVVQTEDQGGSLTWVIGLEEGYVFGYSISNDPVRIVIEVKQ